MEYVGRCGIDRKTAAANHLNSLFWEKKEKKQNQCEKKNKRTKLRGEYATFSIIEIDEKIILVKDKDLDKFKCVGGESLQGELPSRTAVREAKEEARIDISTPSKQDRVYQVGMEDHEIIFYIGDHLSGTPTVGDNIRELVLMNREEIKKMIDNDMLFYHHAEALKKYLCLD